MNHAPVHWTPELRERVRRARDERTRQLLIDAEDRQSQTLGRSWFTGEHRSTARADTRQWRKGV